MTSPPDPVVRTTRKVETRLRQLLNNAWARGGRYASAHYREPHHTGESGLNIRFEAFEQAVVELARELDAAPRDPKEVRSLTRFEITVHVQGTTSTV